MIDIILIVGAIAFVVLAAFIIGGVALYDIQDIRAKFLFGKHPSSRRYRTRPIVTAIIIASPKTDATRQCLESLRRSSYRRLEVIIITPTPSATLKRLVTSYNTRARSTRLFTSKRSENNAIDAAYRRYGHGEIILILQDTDALDPTAISKAIWHFNARDAVSHLHIHRAVPVVYSSSRLFQIYTSNLRRLSRKLTSTFSNPYSNMTATFYRKEVFMKRRSLGNTRSYLADDIVSYCQPSKPYLHFDIHSYKTNITQVRRSIHVPAHLTRAGFLAWCVRALLTLSVGTLLVCLPILLGYFIFLAFVLHQALLILLCMVTTSLFLLFGIWSNRHYTLRKKFVYSLLIPASFIPFLLYLLIQLVGYIIAAGLLVRENLLKLLGGKKYSLAKTVYEYD